MPTGPRRAKYVLEFSDDSAEGYYVPEKEHFVFEGPSLVRVRAAPNGTLAAKDCPEGAVVAPSAPIVATDSITLARTGCYGTCPSYEVTLFGDGRVNWRGYGFVEALGERTYQIEAAVAEKVLQRFRSPEVLGLCGDYSRSVTDSASSMTTIAVSSTRKTVHDYADSSPGWFRQARAEFEAAVQTHSMRHGDPITEPLVHIQEEYLPKPGVSDLMRAAARGDLAKLRSLVAAGARLEDTDASGWTAMMYAAASFSSGGALGELLRAGANRIHRSPFGGTVLMASALKGSFYEHPAIGTGNEINAQNRDGVTVLMLLAARGRVDEIRAALKAGANAKLKDNQGRWAVDYLDALSCHKSLVRGFKQFMEITGPCSDSNNETRKARSLLVAAAKEK